MQADEIDSVVALARSIWNRHYPGIISQAQIDYMLDQRYTPARLAAELRDPDIDWSLALLGVAADVALAPAIAEAHLAKWGSWEITHRNLMRLFPEADPNAWRRLPARRPGCRTASAT